MPPCPLGVEGALWAGAMQRLMGYCGCILLPTSEVETVLVSVRPEALSTAPARAFSKAFHFLALPGRDFFRSLSPSSHDPSHFHFNQTTETSMNEYLFDQK